MMISKDRLINVLNYMIYFIGNTLIECTFLRTSNRTYIEQSSTSNGRNYKHLFISRFKLEFAFIKQKLSEVNGQDSSSSVDNDGVLGLEVPASNSGKFFFQHFCATFYPHGDCSIRVSQSITLLLFKPSKGTATMISLCTHQFSSYSHAWFIL